MLPNDLTVLQLLDPKPLKDTKGQLCSRILECSWGCGTQNWGTETVLVLRPASKRMSWLFVSLQEVLSTQYAHPCGLTTYRPSRASANLLPRGASRLAYRASANLLTDLPGLPTLLPRGCSRTCFQGFQCSRTSLQGFRRDF